MTVNEDTLIYAEKKRLFTVFEYDRISDELPVLVYISLVLANSLIGFLACYSMGLSDRADAEEEKNYVWHQDIEF